MRAPPFGLALDHGAGWLWQGPTAGKKRRNSEEAKKGVDAAAVADGVQTNPKKWRPLTPAEQRIEVAKAMPPAKKRGDVRSLLRPGQTSVNGTVALFADSDSIPKLAQDMLLPAFLCMAQQTFPTAVDYARHVLGKSSELAYRYFNTETPVPQNSVPAAVEDLNNVMVTWKVPHNPYGSVRREFKDDYVSARHGTVLDFENRASTAKVLTELAKKFSITLNAPGIIYSMRFGYLPPEWGYSYDSGTATPTAIANSIASYGKASALLKRMQRIIRRRALHAFNSDNNRSFFTRFVFTLEFLSAHMLNRNVSGRLPETLRTLDRNFPDYYLEAGRQNLDHLLRNVQAFLPHNIDSHLLNDAAYLSSEVGVGNEKFVDFATRLDAFADGFRTLMASAAIEDEFPDDEIRQEWEEVFPQQAPATHTLVVGTEPKSYVLGDGNVHILVVPIEELAGDDSGKVSFQDVFANIEGQFPGRIRQWLKDVDFNPGRRHMPFNGSVEIDVPGRRESTFSFEAPVENFDKLPGETMLTPLGFTLLHDDTEPGSLFLDAQHLFGYVSTRHPGNERMYRVETSAMAFHERTETQDAMLQNEVNTIQQNALFSPDGPQTVPDHVWSLSNTTVRDYQATNRFTALMASDMYRPAPPFAKTESTIPHVVLMINDPSLYAHGAPTSTNRDGVIARIF